MTPLAQIFAAIDVRLAAVVQPGGSYERMPSGDPDRFPALSAFDEGDEPEEREAGSDRQALIITVEGYVEGFGGAATHDQMAELHADTVQALTGDAGSNLAGLVENIERVGRRRVAVAELAKKRRLGFAQDFALTYSTVRGDPGQFA